MENVENVLPQENQAKTLSDEDLEFFNFGLQDRSEEDSGEDDSESMPLDLSCGSADLSGIVTEEYAQPLHTSTPSKRRKSSLTCDQCGNTYKTKYGLNNHMKHTHLQDFKHTCQICGRGFTQTRAFRSHVASHNKLAVAKCSDCGKNFTGHSSLKRHQLICNPSETVASNISKFVCEFCAIEFKTKEYLRAHQRGKHQDPKYVCDRCGKAYAWRSSLKVHKNKCK